MAEVVLFHHALGLTPGVRSFAGELRAAGHTVHTPDLYDGRTFTTVEEGVDHARSIGFDTIIARGAAFGEGLPAAVVHAGFSLGVLPAQLLAQTRPGALAALLLEACVPVSEFGGRWPDEVPVQVHGMENDPSFAGEGDLDAARDLVAQAADGELVLYPGDGHLFTDPASAGYDAEQARVLTARVLKFLARF
ncbi:dienelactone hydrolase [Actinorhabdospora filicis]|uniref:Dienelactone hydrolase n=1 Tax=Actinorhabdospora filicis TaxID=1785913 RepID=A0A9W6SSI8_9ACTN|nr:dienelactone hydrolase family protein [Actinorhabdospora filicis]GLZ81558.1 dienelactone hydrolase [Actinorhabdospora filicis]